MTDDYINHHAQKGTINSEQFRRTRAEKLRTADAEDIRDVTAGDLEKMYQTVSKRNNEDHQSR